MSLKVIELNDSAIKVGDDSGLLLQSPGFALTAGTGLQLGEAAEQQAIDAAAAAGRYGAAAAAAPLPSSPVPRADCATQCSLRRCFMSALRDSHTLRQVRVDS